MYNVILVVIYRLTKIAYFIIYNKAIDTKLFSKVLFKTVISYYRTLEEIVLDKDKLFTLRF